QRLAHRGHARIRAEVAPRDAARSAVQGQPRPRFLGDQHAGIALVVAQQHVVARPPRLDQPVLQQQRLGLGAGDRDLHARDLGQHGDRPRRLWGGAEVGGDALFQRARLAHVEHALVAGDHAVDARRGAQSAGEGLAVEGRRLGGAGAGRGCLVGHSPIGMWRRAPVRGSKRSTAWASVSAIQTAPAATASPADPCRRCGSSTVLSSPPPRRSRRSASLPPSAIHSTGESGSSAIASGCCSCASVRAPSALPYCHWSWPTRVDTTPVRALTLRIAEPAASQTYSICCTAASATGSANAAPTPLPSVTESRPEPATSSRPGAPRSYFHSRLSPAVAMNSAEPLRATARGWSSATERGSRIAPSAGVPARPAPQMVSLSPLRSSILRTGWCSLSATYRQLPETTRPVGKRSGSGGSPPRRISIGSATGTVGTSSPASALIRASSSRTGPSPTMRSRIRPSPSIRTTVGQASMP